MCRAISHALLMELTKYLEDREFYKRFTSNEVTRSPAYLLTFM